MALCPTALLSQPLQLTEPSPELLSLSPGLNQGKQASFDGWLALLVAPRVGGGGGEELGGESGSYQVGSHGEQRGSGMARGSREHMCVREEKVVTQVKLDPKYDFQSSRGLLE